MQLTNFRLIIEHEFAISTEYGDKQWNLHGDGELIDFSYNLLLRTVELNCSELSWRTATLSSVLAADT